MKTSVLVVATAGAGLLALGVADAAYRTRDWGAVDSEVSAVLPGDDLVPEPADTSTVAVSVTAPPDEVWHALHSKVVEVTGGGGDGEDDGPRLVRVVPGRAVVLAEGVHEGPEGMTADVVRSFHVVPTLPGRCRLVARSRETRSRQARTGTAGRVAARALDPVAAVLTRRLLYAVATRAQAAVTVPAARRGTARAT